MVNHVEVHNDVFVDKGNENRIHFQEVTYHIDSYEEKGFRFIWSRNWRKLPHKGQARIPDSETLFELLNKAKKEGWFN